MAAPAAHMSGDAAGPSTPDVSVGLGAQVIQKCTDILQEFRDGTVTKVVATTRIMSAIPDAFVEGGRGQQVAHIPKRSSPPPQKEAVVAAGVPALALSMEEAAEVVPALALRMSKELKEGTAPALLLRMTSPNPSGVESMKECSHGSWRISSSNLLSLVAQNRKSLLEFSKDPKLVVGTILNSSRHPAFPVSEWTAIVKGDAIDLNKVITNQFSVSHERHHTESIGDGVHLLFGSSTPTKTVTSQSEWITVVYRQYIMDLFTNTAEHVHERVILLDRRLRNEAAGRRDLLLSDCSQFHHWERAFLNDNGAAFLESKPKAKDSSSRGAGGSGGGGEKQKKIKGNRYNEERCPATKSTCRYAHICSRCKHNHPFPKCDRPSAAPRASRRSSLSPGLSGRDTCGVSCGVAWTKNTAPLQMRQTRRYPVLPCLSILRWL
ncbi:hypothetical protein B0H13DRAFT_1853459 [Mycena leptocephala]|nr:hypothetical protein B0H13DRAFT_1853459 [Mycena leptocephala]